MDLDNVHKPFVWRKKYEELGVEIDEKKIEAESRRRAEENKVELEKIRERQRKRELEYQQKLSDGEFLSRQREAEHHEHWEQQEDDFVLRQHRHRSKIRIRDGRAKPIDLLAHYIDTFGVKPELKSGKDVACIRDEQIDLSDSPVELLNPCDWFNGLRKSDLEALEPDIRIYMSTDYEQNQQYWTDLLDLTRNELFKLQAVQSNSDIKSSACCSDINSTVLGDVMLLFKDKSIEELDDLEEEMNDILASDDPSVDSAFYENALSRLRAHRAKMRLTLNHKENLKRQKSKILDAPEIKSERIDAIKSDESYVKVSSKSDTISAEDGQTTEDQPEAEDRDFESDNDLDQHVNDDRYKKTMQEKVDEYERNGYSPKMYRRSELNAGIVTVDYEKEYELLMHQRNQISNATSLDEAKMATMSTEERAFIAAASKGMDSQEESTFSCETNLRLSNNYIWADKYQPRKPRYFNRVHTGFEWNKYNQTHYDIDNPPPKVVQGYKFNIFYPDLIDKSKAPTFTLTPCKEDKDFCTIRFSAGPPYEDIAFRIVNREWNNSHKSGYRCQFINNMLQLWFQFKRYRYRR